MLCFDPIDLPDQRSAEWSDVGYKLSLALTNFRLYPTSDSHLYIPSMHQQDPAIQTASHHTINL